MTQDEVVTVGVDDGDSPSIPAGVTYGHLLAAGSHAPLDYDSAVRTAVRTAPTTSASPASAVRAVPPAGGWPDRGAAGPPGASRQALLPTTVHDVTDSRSTTASSAGQTETASSTDLTVRVIGGPTAVLELGGLRLLTDPTFDLPGVYPIGSRALVKTTRPAMRPADIGPVDAVLLSHDQHADNLDTAGRAFLPEARVVLTTPAAAERLGGNARALLPWETVELRRPDGRPLRVTGVPARHGPVGCEPLTGQVTGFVLSGAQLPTTYVSGDNASLDLVRQVGERCGPIEIAVLFAGAARTPLVDAPLTLTSAEAAEAAGILGARAVVPLHIEGWEHFTQGPDTVVAAFAAASLSHVLIPLTPGGTGTV